VLAAVISTLVIDSIKGGVAQVAAPKTPFAIQTRVNYDNCGKDYVVNRRPDQMPVPSSIFGREDPPDNWWKGLGGVDVDNTTVELTLHGQTAKSVVLHDLKVKVTSRKAPLSTGEVYFSGQCGGGITPRLFLADLDRSPVTLQPQPGETLTPDVEVVEVPAINFPYKISDQDPEILLVTVRTKHCDCMWHLLLSWSQGEDQGIVKIDMNGRDFRTTAATGLHSWGDSYNGKWVRES
jgi:hypothetical protein